MIKTLKIILVIVLITFSFYHISLWTQKRNIRKYGTNFNSNRKYIGLEKLNESYSRDTYTWDNWNNLGDGFSWDNKFSKFMKILSLTDITTGTSYENNSESKDEINHTKVLYFNTNLLFWKNRITSEMDIYYRILDSVTEESLIVRYYFEDDNRNKDYFTANHYLNNLNEINLCNEPAVMRREAQRVSGKPYYGNINKKQADSILKDWR